AVGVARNVLVAEADLALEARLDEGRIRDLSRTADVEGTHSKLRAGLADGLRRDDAHCLAVVDRGTPGQVAAIAGGADAVLRLADEHGADLHLLDTGSADRLEMLLFDHRALRNDDGAVLGDQIL